MTTSPAKGKSGLTKPLAGKRILVGRAAHQASAMSDELRELGATIIEVPFIEIRPPQSWAPLDAALAGILDYDWLILTSTNGVAMLFARLKQLGKSEADLLHLDIAAIGPATAKAVETHGLPVDVVPEHYVAESVVEALKGEVAGKRVLLVRAKVARDVIPRELVGLGAKVDVVAAYETVLPGTSAAAIRVLLRDPEQRPDAVVFTSSSTVTNFLQLLGDENRGLLTGVKMASIGPVTSDTLRKVGLKADIQASEYTIPALVEALAENL